MVRGRAAASALRQFAWLLGLAWVLGLAGLPGAQPGSAALPSATHAGDLARVEDYLNGLTTLKADFVQINPDGGTVTGELYYERPDKMRLDYDPPSDILIVSDGWQHHLLRPPARAGEPHVPQFRPPSASCSATTSA